MNQEYSLVMLQIFSIFGLGWIAYFVAQKFSPRPHGDAKWFDIIVNHEAYDVLATTHEATPYIFEIHKILQDGVELQESMHEEELNEIIAVFLSLRISQLNAGMRRAA